MKNEEHTDTPLSSIGKVDITYKTGDLVQLKSGSPYLTCVSITEDKIEVIFADGDMNIHLLTIPSLCLKKV